MSLRGPRDRRRVSRDLLDHDARRLRDDSYRLKIVDLLLRQPIKPDPSEDSGCVRL